jgi:hypothetical protein
MSDNAFQPLRCNEKTALQQPLPTTEYATGLKILSHMGEDS